MIPDFPLELGFLLGGIVSPPDAIAATSVLSNLKVSRQVTTILEGESLVNDASSLIVYRFALAALFTGRFVFWKAGLDFLMVIFVGILIGLVIAHIVYAIHRWLPTTPSIDTGITFISPYLMYIVAEHFHSSGVLAVVSGGLFLSYRSQDIFDYGSRLTTTSVWNVVVFLLNGVVFILIGLQLPGIIRGLGEYSLRAAIGYGVVISLVAIVVRLLWVYPGAYLPRLINRRIRRRETRPPSKQVFILGWSGMRGVVSLAAALAIPIALPGGEGVPHRNLILCITFIVILITLVVQGLSLPWLIRWLKIVSTDGDQEKVLNLKLRLDKLALEHIDAGYAQQVASIEPFSMLRARYDRKAQLTARILDKRGEKDAVPSFMYQFRNLQLELIRIQREELARIRHRNEFPEELIRNEEFEMDLEEARIRRIKAPS
jgi:Na+/H+ antiporter